MQSTKDQKHQPFVRKSLHSPIHCQDQAPLITSKKIQNYIYNYSDLLGQGNFSKVYRGVNQLTNQQIAIKIVELSSITSAKLEELLNSQIQILKTIKHENVVQCLQVLSSQRNCYIITELCEGGDLATLLNNKGVFTEKEIYRIALDIFQGLRYLSEKKIVHRDLKVSNIFVRNGTAKIADFGFAKVANFTFLDASIGSPVYMSPEGLIYNTYGPKTDIWAFGIILFEMTHGCTPAANCRTEDELKRVVSRQMTFDDMKSNLSVELRELIIRCLDTDQKTRFTIHEIGRSPWIRRVQGQLGIKDSPQQEYQYVIVNSSTSIQNWGQQNQKPLTRIQICEPTKAKRHSVQYDDLSMHPQAVNGVSHPVPNFHSVFPQTTMASNTHKDIKIYRPSQNLMKLISKEHNHTNEYRPVGQTKMYPENGSGNVLKPNNNELRVRNNSFTGQTQLRTQSKRQRPQSSLIEHYSDSIKINPSVVENISLLLVEPQFLNSVKDANLEEKTKSRENFQVVSEDEKGNKVEQQTVMKQNKQSDEDCNGEGGDRVKNRQQKDSQQKPQIKNLVELMSANTKHLWRQLKQEDNDKLMGQKIAMKQNVGKFIPIKGINVSCDPIKIIQQNKTIQASQLVLKTCVILPGMIDFPQCIGILHYCRLLFKYIVLLKEMQETGSDTNLTVNLNINYMKIYSHLLLHVLIELSNKITNRQVTHLKLKSNKESKIKDVIEEYIVKYTVQLGVKSQNIQNSQAEEKLLLLKLVGQSLESDCNQLYEEIMVSYDSIKVSQNQNGKAKQSNKVTSLLLLARYSVVLMFNTAKLAQCQSNQSNSMKATQKSSTLSQLILEHNSSFSHFQKNTKIEEVLDTRSSESNIDKYLKLRKQLFDKDEQRQFDKENVLEIKSKVQRKSVMKNLSALQNSNAPILSNKNFSKHSLNVSLREYGNCSAIDLNSTLHSDPSKGILRNYSFISPKNFNKPSVPLLNRLGQSNLPQTNQEVRGRPNTYDLTNNQSAIYRMR